MQTPHLFEIKIGHLRDLCRSSEKVFLVVGKWGCFYSTELSTNSYLYPLVVNHF